MKKDYLEKGLSFKEVEDRISQGLVNKLEDNTLKTPKDIVVTNTFNLFNALNLALALLVVLTGRYRNMLFMGVVIANTVIGIIQEIRAYHKLYKLRLLNEPHAVVLRDGKQVKITQNEIVLDDLVKLSIGQEVLSDCVIEKGALNVNESLLTGESDDIEKEAGALVYAGSIITSGTALARVTCVGKDNYIAHIVENVKR